jgi:hypothetical protein
MRNLMGVGIAISLGLSWGCGYDKGTGGTTTGGTSTQPTAAGSGSKATSAGSGTAAAAGKGAAGSAATGTSTTSGATTSGAKAGAGAPATTTTTTTPATSAAAGSGAAIGGAATSTTGATAAAGATGGAAGGGAATGTGTGTCGPENTNPPEMLDKTGPWMPMHVENTGPGGQSWIFFPADLGKDGMKHPVFDWGPGAGTGPDSYVDHLNLIASQGFVVISQSSTASGKAALDWILAENEKEGSMWKGKLDTTRVGQGGHSMGALLTFSESMNDKLSLYVLVCGGGNGTGGAADIHAPSIFLGGEGEGGTANFEGDYAAIKTAPSYFVTKTMTDHIYCARNNLAPWVAFMRMTWCGEADKAKYQKELMDGGTFCKSPWLACKSKNTM